VALHVRGTAVPSGEPVECWIDGDRLSRAPLPGAQTVVDGGFLLPGLTDAHSHPGRGELGVPLDEARLRADASAHARAGVALLRALGSPDRPLPDRFSGLDGADGPRGQPGRPSLPRLPGLPRILDAGVPLGVPGQFPRSAGRIVAADDLPAAAAEHCLAAGGGWCKLYADWIVDDATLAEPTLTPAGALAEAVRRVHSIGGRVAVHAMHAESCRAVVEAGADSLEHGLWLDPALLPRMAAQGTALTPTITVWRRQLDGIEDEPEPVRSWFLDGVGRLPWLAEQARAAGVTVLAGTDSQPHGRIAEEIRNLAEGLPAEAALAAGSWAAREFLGLPGGLDDGAPADIVAFPADPRADLSVLDHPSCVIIRGQLIR
jgi:imidazolonepropionase-like amidohydrolase